MLLLGPALLQGDACIKRGLMRVYIEEASMTEMCLDLDKSIYFTSLSFRYGKQPAVYCVFLKEHFAVSL